VKTVLILGAGGAAANSVARCLTRSEGYRVIGANADPYDLALADANVRVQVPRCGDPRWRDAIMRLIDESQPDFVHAQPESEVLALSQMRDDLPGGDLMVGASVVTLTQDKWASWGRWRTMGVPVPKTLLIRDRDDIQVAFEAICGDEPGEIWLRSTMGAGGAGSLRTASAWEAGIWIDRHDGWGRFTAAEVLGPDTAVFQGLWRDGRLVVGQSKRRLRWANARNVPSGVGGSAAISETCSAPIISETALRAVAVIDPLASGIFNVDMVLDAAGEPRVTEINAGRFNTTVDFFAVAGLNLPDWHFSGHQGGITPVIDPLDDELLWIRSMDRPPVFTTRALMERESAPMEVAA
jgi:hypothetical protein